MPTEKTYDRILAYLKGLLSDRQRHDLEKEMMRDVFEEEAFEGLSQLSAAKLQADMDKLGNKLENLVAKDKKRNLTIYFRLAAGVLLVVGLSSLLYLVFRTPTANLITEEKIRKEESTTIVSPGPLMETKSAPSNIEEKEKTPKIARKKSAFTLQALPMQSDISADVKEDTFAGRENMSASDELVIVSYEDKKMKNIQVEVVNEPAKDISSTAPGAETALQGKAAGVQVNRKSEYEASQPKEELPSPVISKPIPPGGSLKVFKKWVTDRLDYSAFKAFPGKQKVIVELTVHGDGTIGDIRIKNSVPAIFGDNLKKVISQSPPWKPAFRDDTPMETQVAIRFVFEVE